nr:uncharacterized protein LOC114921535 isoform X1 [Labrus bergylta]XP_029137636.1 uncharacterized protein LOC114921535 isoform X1 [Labrus bergylta]XP_029137637.1 uncharacterized protein LOC114921535 isoform X1 [Labrus bergylta]
MRDKGNSVSPNEAMMSFKHKDVVRAERPPDSGVSLCARVCRPILSHLTPSRAESTQLDRCRNIRVVRDVTGFCCDDNKPVFTDDRSAAQCQQSLALEETICLWPALHLSTLTCGGKGGLLWLGQSTGAAWTLLIYEPPVLPAEESPCPCRALHLFRSLYKPPSPSPSSSSFPPLLLLLLLLLLPLCIHVTTSSPLHLHPSCPVSAPSTWDRSYTDLWRFSHHSCSQRCSFSLH